MNFTVIALLSTEAKLGYIFANFNNRFYIRNKIKYILNYKKVFFFFKFYAYIFK